MKWIRTCGAWFYCLLRKIYYIWKLDSIFGKHTYFNPKTKFEGYTNIERNTVFINCEIGLGSDFGPNCKWIGCKIGKYCLTDANNWNIVGNHPIKKFVAMNSKFYEPRKRHGFATERMYNGQYKYVDDEKKYYNIIGNDVYITNNVLILEGVKIGDGAVITPGSVVTKNVPAYAIVRGNPAQVIAYRFSEDDIKFLEELKWWDKSDAWIKENIAYFSDVKKLRMKIEEEHSGGR